MRAVAVALLGYGDAAEDAVQDAVLLALGHGHDLRDPMRRERGSSGRRSYAVKASPSTVMCVRFG